MGDVPRQLPLQLGLGPGPARVPHQPVHDLASARVHHQERPFHHLGPLHRRLLPPLPPRIAGGGEGFVHVPGVGERNLREHFTRPGARILAAPAAAALAPLSVDEDPIEPLIAGRHSSSRPPEGLSCFPAWTHRFLLGLTTACAPGQSLRGGDGAGAHPVRSKGGVPINPAVLIGAGALVLRHMTRKIDAALSGTFRIGGELEINRLGFGAMRITGPGIWGPPQDSRRRAGRSPASPNWGSTSSTRRTATAPMSAKR